MWIGSIVVPCATEALTFAAFYPTLVWGVSCSLRKDGEGAPFSCDSWGVGSGRGSREGKKQVLSLLLLTSLAVVKIHTTHWNLKRNLVLCLGG